VARVLVHVFNIVARSFVAYLIMSAYLMFDDLVRAPCCFLSLRLVSYGQACVAAPNDPLGLDPFPFLGVLGNAYMIMSMSISLTCYVYLYHIS
jgi:hypothetical protein